MAGSLHIVEYTRPFATIVAQEMNKPCVIGARNATKVLKDGDEVEVDAEKGVVKILKRA